MELDEITISKAITETFMKDFLDAMEVDVAVVGAGPAGMTAAYFLARAGMKTVIFEGQLRVGGGMPGGGMMFNHIVVQQATSWCSKKASTCWTSSVLEAVSTNRATLPQMPWSLSRLSATGQYKLEPRYST